MEDQEGAAGEAAEKAAGEGAEGSLPRCLLEETQLEVSDHFSPVLVSLCQYLVVTPCVLSQLRFSIFHISAAAIHTSWLPMYDSHKCRSIALLSGLVRLSFHDSGTWSQGVGNGGPDGETNTMTIWNYQTTMD